MEEDYAFSRSGIYKSIAAGSQADYLNYIETLPLNPSPEAFGLHDNAEITNAQNASIMLLDTVLNIQPRTGGGTGKSREDVIEDIATMIEMKIPIQFIDKDVRKKYPVKYEESMNTVLLQEMEKYNKLLGIMKNSLFSVKRALKGFIVMDETLEKLAGSLFNQQVILFFLKNRYHLYGVMFSYRRNH